MYRKAIAGRFNGVIAVYSRFRGNKLAERSLRRLKHGPYPKSDQLNR